MPRPAAITLAFLLFAPGLAATAAAELELEPCELTSSQGVNRVEAECGWLQRPEDPEAPLGKAVRLKVAVIRSLSPDPQPDAFTVINGGPGGSSVDLYVDTAGVYAGIRRERDIVIVDQRGTGASNPMGCADLQELDQSYAREAVLAATRRCLDELPGDPRFYTTSVAVRDLEVLREALGYSQLNVYGVSYGTRVALHYARRYPESIRSLVIDGVLPPSVPLGANAALNAQRTLDRLFARCAEDPDCSGVFPSLEADFETLRRRLARATIELEVAHPVSGEREPISLSAAHLAITVRMLSYVPETASLLPVIITEAEQRQNYVPIATNALRVVTALSDAIRFGMHNSVICTEDIPFLGEVDMPALAASYIGPEQLQSLETICSLWPTGPIDEDFHQPVTTRVPTLILSGAEDPITPPEYGAIADRHLPDSLHLVARGQGHGVVSRGCFPRLLTEFVDAPQLEELDATCAERFDDTPFFLDLMGPAP